MSTLLEYKCPHCGGAIKFDSDTQKMKCPYCDSEFDVETLKELDRELGDETPDEIEWQEVSKAEDTGDENTAKADSDSGGLCSYVCNSCGGEIICDETTAATTCPFCGNPVVMMGQFKGAKKPDLIVPFKVDKEAAKESLKNHLKGKTLLPKLFSEEEHIDEIKGVYVPFWLFDTDADATVYYSAIKERMWTDARFNYVESNHYRLRRTGRIGFLNVPVDGSSKMPDELMESIEPYDMSEAVDFQTAYLAGYLADKYDVLSEDCINRVNARIKKSTEDAFLSTVSGYNSVSTDSSSIKTENGKVKYALLPVWLLNTSWNDHTYTFAMNGQSGKFVGDLPMDRARYWGYFAGISAIAALFLYLLAAFYHYILLDQPYALSHSWILYAIVFGIVVGFMMVSVMKNQLKSVGFKASASDYVRGESLKLTGQNDLFIYRRVATTPRAGVSATTRMGTGNMRNFSRMGGPPGGRRMR